MANSNDISRPSTSIDVKITNSITSDPLGTDGIDIDDIVAINKMVNNVLYVRLAPSSRDMNIVDIAKNIAVPFVFKVTPSVRTNFDMRLSLFMLTFMQRSVVGSVTALHQDENFQTFQVVRKNLSITLTLQQKR